RRLFPLRWGGGGGAAAAGDGRARGSGVEGPTRMAPPPRLEVMARVRAPLPVAAGTLTAPPVGAPLPVEGLMRAQTPPATSAPRLSAHAADHAMQHRPGSGRACSLRIPGGPWETRQSPHTQESRQP